MCVHLKEIKLFHGLMTIIFVKYLLYGKSEKRPKIRCATYKADTLVAYMKLPRIDICRQCGT